MSDQEPIEDIIKRLCTMEAPLGERLATFSAVVRERERPFADAYDELAERLSAAKAGNAAPQTGELMPNFVLPDAKLRLHTLEGILEKGPAVLSFNRGHWCPYCAVELSALKQALSEFKAAGAQVVSIMPDTPEFVAKASADIDDAYLILSDENNGYALQLNLVIWLGDRIRELNALELSLETSQNNKAWFVPIPATFVVGAEGRIIARFVDPDFRRRMEIDDIMAALKRAWS